MAPALLPRMTILPVALLPFRASVLLLALSLGMAAGAARAPTCVPKPRPAIEEVHRFHYRIARGAFLRVLRDRPSSLVTQLGLESGDVIERVNGIALTSPERALEVYRRLRGARRIFVALTRRGAPLTLVYDIVD
jgi:hypothetical protein